MVASNRLAASLTATLFLACSPPSPLGGSAVALRAPGVRIVALYLGGGNAGAVYDRDFVVLANTASVPVSTDGMSVQYASASGTAPLGATELSRTPLPNVTLAPGAALLVGGAPGANGAPLAPDVVDASAIALSSSGGRLGLVNGEESLGCNGASTPCDATALARLVDFVGWGEAAFAEGQPAAAPAVLQMLARRDHGCVDTDDNASDFERVDVAPRMAADAPLPCAVATGDAASAADAAHADAGLDAAYGDAGLDAAHADTGLDAGLDGGFDAGLDAGLDGDRSPAELQGPGFLSPMTGQTVRGVLGCVGYASGTRFSLEDAHAGVFVVTESPLALAAGSWVRVSGRVVEQRAPSRDFGATTLLADAVALASEAAAGCPAPAPFTGLGASLATRADVEDREAVPALDADTRYLDALERLEGRTVRLDDALVVGATRFRGDGRREVAVRWRADALVEARGALVDASPLVAPGELVVVDTAHATLPVVDVGDALAAPVLGVVDREWERPVLRLVRSVAARRSPPTESRRLASAAPLEVATLNVHGLCADTDAGRLRTLARTVSWSLGAPTVVALQEVGDDSCASDDGVVTAERGLARFVDAVVAEGGPAYEPISLAPSDGLDGGAPGLNIRVALLVRTGAGVSVVRRLRADGTSALPAEPREASEVASPGRLGVDDPAFLESRKPLVLELDWRGARLLVVAVHLRSRLGDDSRYVRRAPPSSPSEALRAEQASAVARFVGAHRRFAPGASVVVLGDFNDEADSPALAPLRDVGLAALTPTGPAGKTTYVHEGVASSLDHVFVSSGLAAASVDVEVVGVGAHRALGPTDHDAVLATFGGVAPEGARGSSCTASPADPARVGPTAACLALLLALLGRRRP